MSMFKVAKSKSDRIGSKLDRHDPADDDTAGAKEAEKFRWHPVNKEITAALESRNASRVEILDSDKMYKALCKYIAEHATYVQSWRVKFKKFRQNNSDFHESEESEMARIRSGLLSMHLGLGQHEMKWKGEDIKIIHQVIGDPVGLYSTVEVLNSLVIYIEKPNMRSLLKEFLTDAWEFSHKARTDRYKVYSWQPDCEYWRSITSRRNRPIESIILPQQIKDMVVKDLLDFCSRKTACWYIDHGVPYKRSLLFYGPPGTGKSSLITGLAGLLRRDVCFLQPSHPKITDDNLQCAIQKAPTRSLIVMEDVDALFDSRRKKEESQSPLTFSGLLNALDGVCNPEGQIFILTTNHIDRLDPALIRAGRVDVKIPFPSATARQAENLFLHFYPGEFELAKRFATIMFERFPSKHQGKVVDDKQKDQGKVKEKEKEKNARLEEEAAELLAGWSDSHRLAVSMAALGQHFIACRHDSAAEAVERAAREFNPENQEEEEEKRRKEEEEAKAKREEPVAVAIEQVACGSTAGSA
jgi:chaperone BCS1